MNMYRTHLCNALNLSHVGEEVTLSGWIFRKRDHGGILFIDLRDFYGITQLVLNESSDQELFNYARSIGLESVITVKGTVAARSEDTINTSLSTGHVEVAVHTLVTESAADALPIHVPTSTNHPEDLRLKYRFLDLRCDKVKSNMLLRSAVISEMRKAMESRGFIEVQTPILTASSPEGARDYLVPSRVHAGKFYALPQAPQIFKQLLMASGFDKYFQIAPCFRDEDARADRSPGEFYQLDVEMSFVTQEDVFSVMEPVLRDIFTKFAGNRSVSPTFPRITYKDAMLRYGTDKPDLRNPIIIADVSEVFLRSNFKTFQEGVARGMVVRAIPAPKTSEHPRSFFDSKVEYAKKIGARGLGYITFSTDNTAKGPVAKFLSDTELANIQTLAGVGPGDSVFFVSDAADKAAELSGSVRELLGTELNLIEKDTFKFCWIVDFPYFQYENGKLAFSHNPFSMPQGGLDALSSSNPLDIVAYQYDIVCNGIEISSGAIRNHKLDILYKAFSMVGYSPETVDAEFGALTRAFRFGVPPHGGIAPGVDRIVMLLADVPNIREIIYFPLTQMGEDLLMGAPSEVNQSHLKELYLALNITPKAVGKTSS
ncbi:aspartate--tRNA ligase [Anaplasma phagocytophilum]|uniref:Aspartate--tRNA(Asp/Asn) ligase n=2 Tax=Anaplasma phagocytophilum TaxID=948 RepID=A0A0F3Q9H6_ANAPH|nr:aspartate--tRNA ligase [Anaplasma phagocytophilum]EOA62998.1 aspartyl-tRNA ligase [Anaplasma phagocytophilum str. CRT38]KDB57357.1 aspartyl-tRNA synthetase [Anaplasma phagocytophilum str. CRT35]KJV79810.1 aspartate--tRNA ligase [Anaplasma phagocytophilum str. CRT53-1]KJV88074.1 aspartate--tRNA ligase [Anaplasma phagocytophilum str. CRT53-1]